jgi:DNA-directed RNA polymerase specialized sigma24 family protein
MISRSSNNKTLHSSLKDRVYQTLQDAYYRGHLPAGLTVEMLSPLSQALHSPLQRYLHKHLTFPPLRMFEAIANNYIEDGPLVQMLLNYDQPEAVDLWRQLHSKLIHDIHRHWPGIGSDYQDKIVGETYFRVYRSLPNFLFKSRLNTWIFTISKNEYLRLKSKIDADLQSKLYLAEQLSSGSKLQDYLLVTTLTPLDLTLRQQALDNFWSHLTDLRGDLDVKILRLYLQGYNQLEIQEKIGIRSNSTISRRINHLLDLIKADATFKEVLQQLELAAATQDQLV